MSTKNHHVILRSRIEITIDQHSENSMVQHTVHKAVQERIIPILSKLFSQYVPKDVVIHLDQLVIDGGTLSLSTLGKELPRQVKQVLMLKLKEEIGKVIHNPTLHQVIPLPDAKRQAIAHYLSEGNFAWWMTERSEKQIEKIYLALLDHTPLLIEQLWSNLNKKEKAVQRCITFFSPATVEHTLACLLKQPIPYFRPILAEIALWLYQTRIFTNVRYTPEQQLLSVALLGMIKQQRAKVDRMGFLNMLLKQVAIQTSISYEKILEKLHHYYAQNDRKSSCNQTTKALVWQLHDMVVTPPKFRNKDVKSQERVLKELDKIGNSTMVAHQLSAAIHGIKIEMDKPDIRRLVKSWLKEQKNREKLVKTLSDGLFVRFLQSINASIIPIFSDFTEIAAATTATIAPACAIKAITLAYCAFEHSKRLYFKEIQSLLKKYIANSVINPQGFARLLATQAYNPEVKSIILPLVSIAEVPLASDATKTTIHQDPISHEQPWIARLAYVLDNAHLNHPTIAYELQRIIRMADAADKKVPLKPLLPMIQRIPLSNELLDRLQTLIITLLQSTGCQVNIDGIKNMFTRAAIADPPTTEREYIGHMVDYLASYKPCASNILSDRPSYMATQEAALVDPLQTKYYTHHLDSDPISVANCPLSDVVDFLVYNELPKDQSVPAYVIAKCLGRATPTEICDQLAPLCQEAAILKKLMQHATEVTLRKLFQALIPFPNQMLDALERVIIQSKVLRHTEQQTTIRFIKEIFIKAAMSHQPPTTEPQYVARILLHLGVQASCRPTILCDRLMDAAKQTTDWHLVELFDSLKDHLAPLNLNTIDEVDLIFLSTHETFALDKAFLPFYYSRLLPAIKHMVRQAESADLSQSVIDQLVAEHLPPIVKPLQETISIALYQQITDALQSKKEGVAERWHLFLHTGKLGNYADGTALLNDVIAHLPIFSLAQHKTHVRQRLIAHFTHTQLMLLVQRHSDVGKTLANFIQGSYQLWCAAQGSLGQPHITKHLFWDGVLKTLPQVSISKEDWLAQITTELSNILEITPSTLLITFNLLIEDTKGIPEAEEFTTALNRLQDKHRKEIQQQAIQHGYKEPILTKLYLLLNGNLSLFTQQYHLPMDRLERELIQFIADHPLALSQFLEAQHNHSLVARRMVHYFTQDVTTKIIACLAKEKALFVMHYLDLFSHPFQDATMHLPHLSTWQKELYISIMYYLITKSQFKETEFVHSTLLTTCYPKQDTYKIITSIVAKRTANHEKNKIITLLKPLIKLFNTPPIGQPTLANNPLKEVLVTSQKEPSQQVSVPEEEVRVYTKNSGLVFLWPFLYDFFKAHNLMVGNQFFCDQAAHNAVYLLQHLVTGKLKSPEWELTLPKLLCGLSYDEVLLPYRAIDGGYERSSQEQEEMEEMEEMEAQSEKQPSQASAEKIKEGGSIASSAMEAIECHSELLIEKVIKRWKSLTKLKETALYQDVSAQNILKSYFLNRLGILTRQEANDAAERKFWQLTIMHQDHDTGNLLPNWSMTSIKLPWMQEKLILFWMSA